MTTTIKRCVVACVVASSIGLLSVLLYSSLSTRWSRASDEEVEEDLVALRIAFEVEQQKRKELLDRDVEKGLMSREDADAILDSWERHFPPTTDPEEQLRRQLEGAVARGRATQEEADRTFKLWQMGENIRKEQAQRPRRGLLDHHEQLIADHEALAEIVDIPPLPSLPYRPRMEALNALVEARGYDRGELYEYHQPVLREIPRLTERRLQRAQQTWEFLSLFNEGTIEELEQRINERLENNPHDIPALLMQLSIYRSTIMPDAAFDVVEEIVDALQHFEPRGLDKRAVLYHAMRSVSVYLTMTEEEVAAARERSQGKLSMGCMEILYILENAGDW